nr:hypothetical protein 33 [Alphaproteobacteria bacterium]
MALTKVGKEGITGISNSSDANAITINSSENVGIGTSSPTSKLEIAHTGTNASPHIKLAEAGDTRELNIFNDGSGNGRLVLADRTDDTPDTEIVLADNGIMQFNTGNSERMRVDSSGRLLINTTVTVPTGQTSKLQVQGGGASSVSLANTSSGAEVASIWNGGGSGTRYLVWFATSSNYNNVGSITSGGSSTSYNTTSDHRLKENVADMTGAIARVKQLAPKRFNFIVDADTTVDGFLAHEAQTVVPEAVTGTHNEVDDDGNPVMQGIDQSKLVPLLTGALQEAIAKIETLETKVAALENA